MIEIAYACDEYYVQQTGISLISMFENYQAKEEIRIWFVDFGAKPKSINLLSEIAKKYGHQFCVLSGAKIAQELGIDDTGRHIASVYAKILFTEMLSVDKVLYLDSDTVITSSIDELYNIELDKYWIAGVETFSDARRNKAVGLDKDDVYLNDGVILLNLVSWRKEKLIDKCKQYIHDCNGNPPILSEGTIAHVCRGHALRISPKFNLLSGIVYFSSEEIEMMTGRPYYSEVNRQEAINKPCVIHYLSAMYNRPWCQNCTHPLKQEYLRYKSISPWKSVPLTQDTLTFRLVLIDTLHRILPKKVFMQLRSIFGE